MTKSPAEIPPQPHTLSSGLAVYRVGHGLPILLMPGPHRFQLPGDGSAGPLLAGLRDLGCQVISFDPPGSGHSSRPARLGMQEMLRCADEALDAAGVTGPVGVFGHSMAGLAALAYALERPERVSRLVLVGTGPGGKSLVGTPGALWNRSHPAFWRMAFLGMLQAAWPRRATEKLMLNFTTRHSFTDQSLYRPRQVRLRDWLRPRKGRMDWSRLARRLDYRPRLGEVRAPVLVLAGRRDPQFPMRCSNDLAEGIPQARLVVFERSGHYPFLEEAEAFWFQVGAFLSGSD